MAVIDGHASVPLVEPSALVVLGEAEEFLEALANAVESASLNLGIASVLPRVSLLAVRGSSISQMPFARTRS